jgi:Sulfotransferase domain
VTVLQASGLNRERLRSRLPLFVRRSIRRAKWRYRVATSAQRVFPRLIIIGAQRAGTSSLFSYLIGNPAIVRPQSKEIHYFDVNYHRGVSWYRAHFPRRDHLERLTDRLGTESISLEASPYYLLHPLAPCRVRGLLPDVKLVVMLRDPVDRAISHYHHSSERCEHLTFEQAIEREPERITSDIERILTVPLSHGLDHRYFSYLARGRYAEQLERWFSVFRRDQFLILDSGDFFVNPSRALRRTCAFIELPAHSLPSYEPLGAGNYPPLDPAIRERLQRYFAPHNERLWELIGEEFDWKQ